MTERLKSRRGYRQFGQIDADCQTPHETRSCHSLLTQINYSEEPERFIHCVPQRRTGFGQRSIVAPHPDDEKPGLRRVCWPYLPRAYPHKGSVDDERLRSTKLTIASYESSPEVREVKNNHASTALESHRKPATFLTLWRMPNYHNLAPKPWPNDWTPLEIYSLNLKRTPFWCNGGRDPHDDHKSTWHLLEINSLLGLSARAWLEISNLGLGRNATMKASTKQP